MLGGVVLAQNGPSEPYREEGHTYPSLTGRTEYRLKIADVVDSIPVKPGDPVKAGQLLLKEDIREEEADRDMYKLVADSDVDIRIAQAKLENAQNDLKVLEGLDKTGNAARAELDKARTDVKVGTLEVEKARLDRETAKLKVKRLEATIAAKQIIACVDGVVEKIDVRPGEVVDPTKPAITVVNNQPLWVEFKPYSAVSLQLKVGQELEVFYDGETRGHKARIIFIDPVVESTSDRQLVRLEMPNPENKPSGLRVKVALPAGVAAARSTMD
jgi:RND family efflux transporter MFP subunit